MRSFGRPSGPSRPAASVTWVTGHRIMRDNLLHPHFQSSRFNPSFRWSSSLVRTFFRPHGRDQHISQAHTKSPLRRLSVPQDRPWFDRRCFSHSSPQGQYYSSLCPPRSARALPPTASPGPLWSLFPIRKKERKRPIRHDIIKNNHI